MDIFTCVIIAMALIVIIGTLGLSIKNRGLRKTVIKLIVEAEEAFEYGKNSEKLNYVFEEFYLKLPFVFKFIFTKENIIRFIQSIFDEIKIALDYKDIKQTDTK